MEEIKDASPAKKEQVKAEVRDTISIILAETGADLEFAASQGEDQLMAKSVEFFGEANSPFKGVSSEGVVFMTHIVQNGLLDEYRDVAEQFVAHYNWENKVVDANVVSATPLTADQSKKLKAKISSNIPKDYTLAFSTTTDPSVLGGFSVELGETYVDLTAKTAIDSYAKELSDSA